jgi:hypothetical protein
MRKGKGKGKDKMVRFYGVQVAGKWVHCPISGRRIEGSKKRMQQYAADLNMLGLYVQPNGVPSVAGAACVALKQE